VNAPADRRPSRSRNQPWARKSAAALARAGVSPDLVSALALAFAVLGGGALALSGVSFGFLRGVLLATAAAAIGARLICELLDGRMAVEHGRAGPVGPLWGELPARAADTVLLVGAGYGAADAAPLLGPALGWLCALLALAAAHVRLLGRALGLPADFTGPLPQPRRMTLLAAAAAISIVEARWGGHGGTLLAGLGLIAPLAGVTVLRRVVRLARRLRRG
jgi:phosphatidylglycerophosphate synthase